MAEITNQELASRIDLVQQGVWVIEERIIKAVANMDQQESHIKEIQSTLGLISERLDKIEKEISALRNNNYE